jgi:glutamyl-tRNA reductase
MYYQVMSFNYKKCDLSNREKLAFKSSDETKAILNRLVGFDFIHEAFIISTCNRVDVVVATRDNFASYHTILGILAQHSGVNFYELEAMSHRMDDGEAIKHLFSVTSSLDSLVIGESQITGQVKEAFRFSYLNGTAGKKLNRIISYAVKCAAEVRNATQISQNPISIASVAVAQAEDNLGGELAGMTGVVVGSGEMGMLAARHLLRAGCDVIMLVRDTKKSEYIYRELGENIKIEPIEKLSKYLNRYRLLFSATSSPNLIVTKEMVEERDFERLWFDMAIPRDIEEIGMEQIQIFRIDDLQNISASNHALRQEQVFMADEIVERYKDEFYQWLRVLSVEPVIKGMREQVSDAIYIELKRAVKKGFVSAEHEANVKKMAQQMFNRFLHLPTKRMRKDSVDKNSAGNIEALKSIFDIDTDNVNLKQYKKDHHTKGYQQ